MFPTSVYANLVVPLSGGECNTQPKRIRDSGSLTGLSHTLDDV